jgi:hypothetical protein
LLRVVKIVSLLNTESIVTAQWVVGASLVFSSFVLVMSSEAADRNQQSGDEMSDVSSDAENEGQEDTDDQQKNVNGNTNTSEWVSEGEATGNEASLAFSMIFKAPVEVELDPVLGCSQL